MTNLQIIVVDSEHTNLIEALGIDWDYCQNTICEYINDSLLSGISICEVMETASILCRNTNEFCFMSFCLGAFIGQRQENIFRNK